MGPSFDGSRSFQYLCRQIEVLKKAEAGEKDWANARKRMEQTSTGATQKMLFCASAAVIIKNPDAEKKKHTSNKKMGATQEKNGANSGVTV